MNWRRGLFRLWIVGSVLFVIAVAVISYRDIKEQFDAAANAAAWEASEFETVVPQLCGEARGVAGEDYSTIEKKSSPNPFDTCWYKISKFRSLYPEYNNLSENELTRKLYPIYGMAAPRELPNPWTTLEMWASIALGIPLAVLLIGASLVWAFSGFTAKRP
jgi:hypothetical protein